MSMERYMFEEKRFQLQSMASAKINVDQILQTRILMSDLDIWLQHSENEIPAQETLSKFGSLDSSLLLLEGAA